MNVRDLLNNNSAVVTILAVLLLVGALAAIVINGQGRKARGPVEIYFFDLNTGKVFVAKSDQLPPIEVESGPTELGNKAGVKAFVYSCGDCKNYTGMSAEDVTAAGGFIARLEMYSAETLAQIEKMRAGDAGARSMPMMMMGPGGMMGGILTKRPGDKTWIDSSSQAGMAMMTSIHTGCPGGERPKLCLPGR